VFSGWERRGEPCRHLPPNRVRIPFSIQVLAGYIPTKLPSEGATNVVDTMPVYPFLITGENAPLHKSALKKVDEYPLKKKFE
jgi:hypothetical protein